MQGTIRHLFHYPIKGLRAQPLDVVDLKASHGFPLDRAFGFARPNSGFDPEHPKPLPKTKFVVLARDATLAQLDTRYDQTARILSITYGGSTSEFDIGNEPGQTAASKYLADHLGFSTSEVPTLYSADPHKFTDVSVVSSAMMNAVSLINLESIAHFEAKIGAPVSPARFRGNIYFDGIPPMAELDWVDRKITIGNVTFKVVMRTKRCPATQVNLDTGVRDLNVPKLLRDSFGHADMGVYAEVIGNGHIKQGDTLRLD